MSFVIRSATADDVNGLLSLAQQFSLLNLPADKRAIIEKVEVSEASFRGDLSREEAKYVFVAEDRDQKIVCGSSQIVAKHGTPGEPTYSFEVLKKERFSRDLGVGFIHQILRLKICENGPTEIGGLVVDRAYRSRPEKIGRLVSLSRFNYIGMYPERFEEDLYAQMAPPLTEEGRSEFWEALGRRFTGMPYQEADLLSQKNKEFIRSLFPEEDIYLCLLDAKARLALGRVSQETQAALHLLESIGFTYMNEVDPFDGGPHLKVKAKNVTLIKNARLLKVSPQTHASFEQKAIVSVCRDGQFIAAPTAYLIDGDQLVVPDKTRHLLEISPSDLVYTTPLVDSNKKIKVHGRKQI